MSRSVNSDDKVEFPELAPDESPVLDRTRLMSRIIDVLQPWYAIVTLVSECYPQIGRHARFDTRVNPEIASLGAELLHLALDRREC